jgi:hypothetical protein
MLCRAIAISDTASPATTMSAMIAIIMMVPVISAFPVFMMFSGFRTFSPLSFSFLCGFEHLPPMDATNDPRLSQIRI